MDIAQIDKNFALNAIQEKDVVWKNALDRPFSLHGVSYDEIAERYARMPDEIASQVSDGVRGLSTHTAGGRIRFITDSPYVAVKAVVPSGCVMSHMPINGSHGFSLYQNGKYVFRFSNVATNIVNTGNPLSAVEGIYFSPHNGGKEYELYFPLYNGVKHLFIGTKEGYSIQDPAPYPCAKKAVFYGSSITQGGCASHAGNDYESHLSRWLGFDFINLGFSGNGKAEPIMCDYLADMHADVYVLDYDHNAPSVAHLQATHLPLYETIRKKNPNAPIVFISRPDWDKDPNCPARRQVIQNTYETAKARGDKKVWFIDGETLFGTDDRDACTVDNCHPNDLGFYRMAQTIRPVLAETLKDE